MCCLLHSTTSKKSSFCWPAHWKRMLETDRFIYKGIQNHHFKGLYNSRPIYSLAWYLQSWFNPSHLGFKIWHKVRLQSRIFRRNHQSLSQPLYIIKMLSDFLLLLFFPLFMEVMLSASAICFFWICILESVSSNIICIYQGRAIPLC